MLLIIYIFFPLLADFSFHLFSEPFGLGPSYIKPSSSNYLVNNIYSSLFRYDNYLGLRPEGAEKCQFSPSGLQITCQLNKAFKFSDGSPVLASHYVKAFRELMRPHIKNSQKQLLLGLKGFYGILKGSQPINRLGVKAQGPYKLLFELEIPDKEFLYRLISPLLSAHKTFTSVSKDKAYKLITTGPYLIKEWKKGQHVLLKPNPHYFKKHPRPDVKVYFISDNTTALNLYKNQTLTFLRRVETSQIPQLGKRKDFQRIPILRFDYIGFNKEMDENLRKALIHSIDYKQLQKLYHARKRPGCIALSFVGARKEHCYDFNIKKARYFFKKIKHPKKTYSLYFSRLGGKDHMRGMQFIQKQWEKILNFKVSLKPIEQKSYLERLKTKPPFLFRKGLSLDRPTCRAALEIFFKNHPENYIGLQSKEYESFVKANQCDKGLSFLMKNYKLIPMGSIDFSILASPQFKNWKLNRLNHLDLSELISN